MVEEVKVISIFLARRSNMNAEYSLNKTIKY